MSITEPGKIAVSAASRKVIATSTGNGMWRIDYKAERNFAAVAHPGADEIVRSPVIGCGAGQASRKKTAPPPPSPQPFQPRGLRCLFAKRNSHGSPNTEVFYSQFRVTDLVRRKFDEWRPSLNETGYTRSVT